MIQEVKTTITFKAESDFVNILNLFSENIRQDRSAVIRRAVLYYIMHEIMNKENKTEHDLKIFDEITKNYDRWV